MSKPQYDAVAILGRLGVTPSDARIVRRISLTLQRWFEHECNGHIQRNEADGKPYIYNTETARCYGVTADREAGAMKRLKAIMARYPALSYYIQGDPRGCSVYIIRPGDVPEGQPVDAYYSRGIAVY